MKKPKHFTPSWRSLTFALLPLITAAAPAALPDLIIWGDAIIPKIETHAWLPSDCEVLEGCAVAGTRRVMRFETQTHNLGPGDLTLGDPVNNPLFHYAPCHGHYHFESFADYRLLDTNGALVVQGAKIGFCLEDTIRWSSNAPLQRLYNCTNQGIQAGWADVYSDDLPCQWLDITGVPPGIYILEIIVDPLNLIAELNENNNVTHVPVNIPRDCAFPPPNDSFAAATFLYGSPLSIEDNNECATTEPDERPIAGNPGGRSVWYRWVAPASGNLIVNTAGSTFDTLLAVYTFDDRGLRLVVENDDLVPSKIQFSQVTLPALAGVEYRIAVDGYDGAAGRFYLNINAPPNDRFLNCATLTGALGATNGWTIGSSVEPGEPSHASTFSLHSVWFCWQAPASAFFQFDTIGSDFDTSLAIYTGTNLIELIPIASDNDAGGNGASRLYYPAVAGTVYRIAVAGRGDAAGHFTLHWKDLSNSFLTQLLPDGRIELSFFAPGARYTLETSLDLHQWVPLAILNPQDGIARYAEPVVSTLRFYRAASTP